MASHKLKYNLYQNTTHLGGGKASDNKIWDADRLPIRRLKRDTSLDRLQMLQRNQNHSYRTRLTLRKNVAGMATSSNASDAATSMAARRAASSTASHASHSGDSRFTSARDCFPDAE